MSRLRLPRRRLKSRRPQTPVVMIDTPPTRGPHDRLRLILLRQGSLPIVACLFIVAVVFTISPEALKHSPTAFDTRGPLHHAWHYTLLIGSAVALVGTFLRNRVRGLLYEQLGLLAVECTLVINLIGVVADPTETATGLGVALRAAAIIQIGIRIWILAKRPTFELPAVTDA